MELVALQCPKCGGAVKYKEADKTYVCDYCGLSFMLKTDSAASDYDKYMKLADSAYDKDRIESAKKYYTLALEARPDDWCADLMIAACDLQQSTWEEYYGDEFKNTVKDVLAKIEKMPREEQLKAKERVAEAINECAIYCNNKLYWDVHAAEFRYEGLDHVFDDDYEHIWDERERPDVSGRDVISDTEKWLLQAIDIVFDIVPKGERLSERQVNIVECQFNYIYACENYSHIDMGYSITSTKDINMRKLKEHNPDYTFKENVNVEGAFHA